MRRMATIKQLPSGHWRAQVRLKGHKPVSKTFRTKAQASQWATKTEDQIRSGTFRDLSGAESRTLKDHLDWYNKTITPRKADTAQKREKSRIKILSHHPELRTCTLATVTPERVIEYVDARKAAGVSGDTIKKELGTLSDAMNAAIQVLGIHMPRGNPVTIARGALKYTKTLQVNDERTRRLLPGEEERLLAQLGPIMRQIVILLIETAMRRGELCNARREHLKGSTLLIPETKTEESRTIPLTARALAAIHSLPIRLDGRLIGHRPDSITQAFDRACKRAGIEDLRLHDLRHEGISRFFEMGLQIQEVALISGHADWRMLKRYTQLRPEDLLPKLSSPEVEPLPPRDKTRGAKT
jgi:integrase